MQLLIHLTHKRLAFSLPFGGEKAQAFVEYAMIIAFISIGGLIAVSAVGGGLLALWAANLTSLLSVL